MAHSIDDESVSIATLVDGWQRPQDWLFRERPQPVRPVWHPYLATLLALLHGAGMYGLYRLMLPSSAIDAGPVQRMVIELTPLPMGDAVLPAEAAAASTIGQPPIDRSHRIVESASISDSRRTKSSIHAKDASSPGSGIPGAGARLRLQMSDDALRAIPDPFAEDRRFDYETPGLRESRRWLTSPVVLEYRATRFDEHWRPTQNLLGDVLDRAVEKTTKEVKIPIPGIPDAKLVCKVSILAVGGGCAIVPNHGYRPQVDDPNTLNAEEVRECEAWYEKIRNATEESAWLRTRALYEAECRKPREKQGHQAPQVDGDAGASEPESASASRPQDGSSQEVSR